MNDESLIGLFVRPLNKLRIPYMVTGGVASVVYGEPRLTRDIDLVLQLRPEDAGRLAAAWSAHDFYVPPVEVIEEESRRTAFGHFKVIHHQTALRADVYLSGDDALNAWAFEHRAVRQVDDEEVFLAPIEAVILSKLRYYKMGKSDRHLRDIHDMLAVSGDLVDGAVLQEWAHRLSVTRELQQARHLHDQ